MLALDPKQFFFRFIAKIKSLFIFRQTLFERTLKGGPIFRFDFSFDPAIKNMYLGIYEMDMVGVMKRVLKRKDIFIDVGANIGYLSTFALGIVGNGGQVHSFEPVQQYFLKLKEAASLNPGFNITVNRCALGEKEGTGKIAVTNLENIGWNTMVPDFMTNETTREIQEVPVRRLDGYIKEKKLDNIALIKIDTEGFEFPVLKGLSEYFKNTSKLPVIICEIAPGAYRRLGYQLSQLAEYMERFKYNAYDLSKSGRKCDIARLEETTNVLFLPSQLLKI